MSCLCFSESLDCWSAIQEYNVRAHTVNKQHFIGRFLQGMPVFARKKSDGTKWCLQREGLQGRQLTEALRVCGLFYVGALLSPFSMIIAFCVKLCM